MQKWFHAIGVCGKTTSSVAKMFKDMGWFVTGTDLNFFEPAASVITKNHIHFEQSYHFSHLTRQFWEGKLGKKLDIPENPDLGLIVESVTSKNKEFLYAKNKGINIKPYSQILGEYLIKDDSVVVVGTAGKTTTTSLITFLLDRLGFHPNYMIGGEVIDFDEPLRNEDTNWSVVEGDEYHSLEFSNGAKFLEYKPTYGIITNIGYEHQDIFPTQKDYIEAFRKFVKLIPADGLLIAKYDDEKIEGIIDSAKCKVIRYKFSKDQKDLPNKNFWKVIKQEDSYSIFDDRGRLILSFKTNLIGNYNLENILAAVILVVSIPSSKVPANTLLQGSNNLNFISKSIAEFKGPKKRLEIKYKSNDLILVDDFGVAPDRAKRSLETLKSEFPDYKITAVYEPNSASRSGDVKLFKSMYKDVFKNAEKVIIPTLSTFDKELATSEQMSEWLTQLGYTTSHIPDDELIVNLKKISSKSLIVFFSSYKLTSILENLVQTAETGD
jgi:UDP-N-acetylmuramate: L-alanyl-gamma-D-glutamyl-meso-diaminopimelate ligase